MPIVVTTTSPTPATMTRSAMVSEVTNYVLLPEDGEAQARAVEGLNDAIRYLNMRNWNWSLTRHDITLVADTAEYGLAASFKGPRAAELLDSSSNAKDRLGWFLPRTFIDAYHDRSTSGTPDGYTVFDEQARGKVTLSCPCSSGFVSSYPTLRLWYFARLAYLTTDGDQAIEAPSEVCGFILWHAKMLIASIYDKTSLGMAKQMRDEVWRMLVRDDVAGQLGDWA